MPYRFAAGQCHRAGVAEAPDTLQRPEVMIEGTVLLHEDDDVFDVLDGSAAARRGDGCGAVDGAGRAANPVVAPAI